MAEVFSPLSLKCQIPEVQSQKILTPYDLGERNGFPWTDDLSGLDPDLLDGIESFKEHLERPSEWELEAWRANNRRSDNRTSYNLYFTLHNPTNEGFGHWYQVPPLDLRNVLIAKPWVFHSHGETINIYSSFGKFPQRFIPYSGDRICTLGMRVDPFPLGVFAGNTYQRLANDPSRVMVGVELMDGVETFPNPELLKRNWSLKRTTLVGRLQTAQQQVEEIEAKLRDHDTVEKSSLGGQISANNRLIEKLTRTPIPKAFSNNPSNLST